jgi:molybdenum cofactor cytidylyltransferase
MPSLAIVPAAGKAERFGGGKLLADIRGEPLLNHTLRSLLDGGLERVVVVLAPGASFETVALLNDPRLMRVVNPDPSRGMFSSIQAGVAAAEGDPILVLPADMPFVKSETVAAVLAAARQSGQIVSPQYKDRHGHPVALPARLRTQILDAEATSTLAMLIEAVPSQHVEVEVDDPGIRRDVDVRGDLTAQ